jgi:hypothetical protein
MYLIVGTANVTSRAIGGGVVVGSVDGKVGSHVGVVFMERVWVDIEDGTVVARKHEGIQGCRVHNLHPIFTRIHFSTRIWEYSRGQFFPWLVAARCCDVMPSQAFWFRSGTFRDGR